MAAKMVDLRPAWAGRLGNRMAAVPPGSEFRLVALHRQATNNIFYTPVEGICKA